MAKFREYQVQPMHPAPLPSLLLPVQGDWA